MIDTYAGIGVRQDLLLGLAQLRQDVRAQYLAMEANALETRCANFADAPELTPKK